MDDTGLIVLDSLRVSLGDEAVGVPVTQAGDGLGSGWPDCFYFETRAAAGKARVCPAYNSPANADDVFLVSMAAGARLIIKASHLSMIAL